MLLIFAKMRTLAKEELLLKLYTFHRADKYATFAKAQAGIINTTDEQKEVVSKILNDCCRSLINLYEATTSPTVLSLKNVIMDCMDALTFADINIENKDFGYELCWFLAEKTGINLKLRSDTKVWGFWRVQQNEVKSISRIRRRKSLNNSTPSG